MEVIVNNNNSKTNNKFSSPINDKLNVDKLSIKTIEKKPLTSS